MTSPAASDAHERTIRELSDRLVDAQRPIRILDAIKWDAGVETAFFADGCRREGFVLIYNFLRLAVRRGLLDRIPLLFCGRTTLGDLRTLAGLVEAELVRPPIYLPPQIRDLGTLAAWLCYANFLGTIDLERIEQDYAGVLGWSEPVETIIDSGIPTKLCAGRAQLNPASPQGWTFSHVNYSNRAMAGLDRKRDARSPPERPDDVRIESPFTIKPNRCPGLHAMDHRKSRRVLRCTDGYLQSRKQQQIGHGLGSSRRGA